MLRDLGQNYPPAEVQRMATQIGQGGLIQFNSFQELMAVRVSSKPPSPAEVAAAIALFDSDGRGFVQLKSLQELMTRYGDKMTSTECADLVEDANPDPSGWVDYNEFAKLICSV